MLKRGVLGGLKFYQRQVRVLLPSACRFTPNCSAYAEEAIAKYGFLKGAYLACRRLLRCHPYSGKSGWDPLV